MFWLFLQHERRLVGTSNFIESELFINLDNEKLINERVVIFIFIFYF